VIAPMIAFNTDAAALCYGSVRLVVLICRSQEVATWISAPGN